jgi:hypothetical protein
MSVEFMCLLVDNAGEPQGYPFTLDESGDLRIEGVANAIKNKRIDIQVPADYITLWKTDPPFPESSQSELSMSVKALHLNVTGNERGVALLKRSTRLKDIFTLPLLPDNIYIIAQLPPSQ